jgi:hypothetical protein
MDAKKAKRTAGALDVRNIIGFLMAVYGVILVAMGIFSDTTAAKSGDVNSNLYAGLALLVVATVFLAWARLRPIVVPRDVDPEGTDREATNLPPGAPPR